MGRIRDKSILVVDDDAGMLRALEKVLTSEGAIVTCAAWPGEAVETLSNRQKHVDLVITDLRMPFVTGDILVDAIRRNLPAVPVIVLTAFSNPDVQAKCYKHGAVVVLEKPLDSTQLLAAIETALGAPPADATANASKHP